MGTEEGEELEGRGWMEEGQAEQVKGQKGAPWGRKAQKEGDIVEVGVDPGSMLVTKRVD
jgi:hypothetical protein